MRNSSTINFSTVLKRSTCINSTNTLNENSNEILEKTFNTIVESIENGKDFSLKNNIDPFINLMSNSESASKFYWKPLKILSSLNKSGLVNQANLFNYQYVTRILPYTEDLSLVKEDLDRFTITEDQKNYIEESVDKLKVADRILGNYNSLSKRFNLENIGIKYSARGLKSFVEMIAEMVDTYNTKNYQKLNVTLEEVDYILSKEGIKYDKNEMAKYVVGYYLSESAYLTDKDLDNYRRTLKENYILNDANLENISFVFEGVDSVNSIESGVNNFLLMRTKTPELLKESIDFAIRNTSAYDIAYNSSKITNLLWDLSKNEIFDENVSLNEYTNIIPNYVLNSNLNNEFSKELISELMSSLSSSKAVIRLEGNTNPDYARASVKFIESIDESLDELSKLYDIVYDNNNINAINYLYESDTPVLALKEFKIFKFHNLIRAAFNLDKFLKVKERRIIDNGKNKLSKLMKKTKSVLFGEAATESDMLKYIDENGRATLVVRQYLFEEETSDLHNFLEKTCKEYNDILASQNDSCRAYYIINPGLAEIKIAESSRADISDIDIHNYIDESFDTYLDILAEVTESNIDTKDFKSLYENIELMNSSNSFTMEQFELALEAMSIVGFDKSEVELFANEFVEYNFSNAVVNGNINESYANLSSLEDHINTLVEQWVALEDIDYQSKLEAYNYFQSIFEYSFPDSSYDDDDEDDDDEDEEEEKKDAKKEEPKKKKEKKPEKKPSETVKDVDNLPKLDPPKGKMYKAQMNLNSIKLGLMGLKTKFKDLDTKYKEAAKNMDNASRAFVTAAKNALVSDRREAIIKGSVIPSFSRCVKAAILLAGVAHFSLPAALIGAMGALALSHKLTKTERLLLLDEIETELEVVDKELQIADSNNQINKYRELLKYKKNLQRQYQRIRYNVRVGKDILPGSTVGVPTSGE